MITPKEIAERKENVVKVLEKYQQLTPEEKIAAYGFISGLEALQRYNSKKETDRGDSR